MFQIGVRVWIYLAGANSVIGIWFDSSTGVSREKPQGSGAFFHLLFYYFLAKQQQKKKPHPWDFSQVCWLLKIFDEIQVLQRYNPRQTKSAYLLDPSNSSDLKGTLLSLCVVYNIALNTLF